MDDIYKNTEEYNPNKKRKILIVFDDIIFDMFNNKKFNRIGTELCIRGKNEIFLLLLSNNLILLFQKILDQVQNLAYYIIIKIPNERELQQIAYNNSSDIDFKDFMNLYKKSTAKPFSFLVIDAILASDNPSHFRNNFQKEHKN